MSSFSFDFTDEQYFPPTFVVHVSCDHVELISFDIHYLEQFHLDDQSKFADEHPFEKEEKSSY